MKVERFVNKDFNLDKGWQNIINPQAKQAKFYNIDKGFSVVFGLNFYAGKLFFLNFFKGVLLQDKIDWKPHCFRFV